MADSTAKEEIIDFVEPQSKEKARRKSGTKTLLLYILAGGLILAIIGVVLGLLLGLKEEDSETSVIVGAQQSRCKAGNEFRNFSVASDTSVCSEIGCHILEKKGSAVDAAIAAMFCITVVTMHSSGIGGGNFMLVYEKQKRKAVFINAREKAPAAANETMFEKNPDNSKSGPLSAGVPGEVKGFIEAHRMYGKLAWSELVQPSVDLASEGFTVTLAVEKAIEKSKTSIVDPDFRELLMNEDGQFKKAGDIIVNPKLAETLREIRDDPQSFYAGKLAKKIAADFKNNGGIITEEDLKNYRVGITEDVMKLDLDKVTMLSCPLPSGGPVITQILNILQNFKFNSKSIADLDSTILTYHRIVEGFKFAYARRPYFGDPEYVHDTKLEEIMKKVLDVKFNTELYKKIWDNSTHNDAYYGGYMFVEDEGSTSHLSVLGPDGDAVSVTGSINYYFGGKFRSKDTGIIYNNEMDDFSTPRVTNGFGYRPARNNFIRPGKRPLSSMSPVIFVDKKTGDVRLVVGAAGGSRIISATAWVSMLNLWMGLSLEDSVKTPRIHHQFSPNRTFINSNEDFRLSEAIQEGLKKKGHVFEKAPGMSVVQAIAYSPKEDTIFAASDPRKGGKAWGS